MKTRTGWRARLTAIGTVALLTVGTLAIGGGTRAGADPVHEDGDSNYAGPRPCPVAGFDVCTNAFNVIQTAHHGGTNLFEAPNTTQAKVVVQLNTTGSNVAKCNFSVATQVSNQICNVTQSGDGGNAIDSTLQASPTQQNTANAEPYQSAQQTLEAVQESTTGNNTLIGTQTINQTEQSNVSAVTWAHQAQQSFQLMHVSQLATTGNNSATITMNRTQTSTATGRSPLQTQDVDPVPTGACAGSDGQVLSWGNGNACVLQRTTGNTPTGKNYLKVRASDTKSENATDLTNRQVAQTQGRAGQDEWLAMADVKSLNNPTGSTVDMGAPGSTTDGLFKNWTMRSQNGAGLPVAGTRQQNDGIRLPLIGNSPCSANTNEATSLSAPVGTVQTAVLVATGHADCAWNYGQKASLVTGERVKTISTTDTAGPTDTVSATTSCSQNAATNSCSSIKASGTAITGIEGAGLANQTASFTDGNTADKATDFTASIDWGDGSTSSGTITGSNGSFIVTGSHTYADERPNSSNTAPYAVKTTVTLNANTAVKGSAASTATIADAALTATGKTLTSQSTLFSGVVASFTDANPAAQTCAPVPGASGCDYSAMINWGDGTDPSAGSISSNSSGGFDVTGVHAYTAPGLYNNIRVSILDKGGASAQATTSLQTSTIALTTSNIAGGEGAPFSGQLGSFTDANANDTASDFVATIDWGDGKTDAANVTKVEGTYLVSGAHTYTDEGSRTGTITVSSVHDPLINASRTFVATVGDAPLSASGTTLTSSSATASGVVATFTDANPNAPLCPPAPGAPPCDFAATITWGDGSVTTGTVAMQAGSTTFTVSGSHTYATNGPQTITVHIADKGGATADATTQFNPPTHVS